VWRPCGDLEKETSDFSRHFPLSVEGWRVWRPFFNLWIKKNKNKNYFYFNYNYNYICKIKIIFLRPILYLRLKIGLHPPRSPQRGKCLKKSEVSFSQLD